MHFEMPDFNKTLKEILNTELNVENLETSLIQMCSEVYNKRILREYSNEDLRCLINQNIALELLIPFALDLLEENLLTEGDFYPGDLLEAVTSVNKTYWCTHIEDKEHLKNMLKKQMSKLQVALDQLE